MEIRKSTNGWQYYFRIVASNGQPLANSEMYNQKVSALSAAQSVKSNAGAAPIVDLA
ncbi:MAG: YegP family protein [Solirubrobacteraceae bacterium]